MEQIIPSCPKEDERQVAFHQPHYAISAGPVACVFQVRTLLSYHILLSYSYSLISFYIFLLFHCPKPLYSVLPSFLLYVCLPFSLISHPLRSPCRKMRLIDVEEFQNRQESMELSIFQHLVTRHIECAKDILLKKYEYM